jgi:hypothetical protein
MKLSEIRSQIKREAPYVGVKSHSHNVISILLRMIHQEHGTEAANKAIRDFGLERKGWSQE